MQETNTTTLDFPFAESKDVLTEILHEGAQALLVQAIEGEVADWIERHASIKDEDGHRLVVRGWPATQAEDHHGYRPGRDRAASRPRSPRWRNCGEVHVEDPPAVLAQDQEH